MQLAMAATYDPDPEAPNGFRLPFDLDKMASVLLVADRFSQAEIFGFQFGQSRPQVEC